jgi:heme/copper-type cytochrome/quinol oxidase subunit 2
MALAIFARGIEIEPVGFQNPAKVVWIMCLIIATATVLCLGLIVHSWQMQHRYTRNKWWLVFWTHVLLFPALTTIVLGLGVIQVSTYDLSLEREQFQYLHWYSGDVKDHLIWLVPLDIILILVWAVVAACKETSSGPNSRPA